VITNYKNTQTSTALKKAYSTLASTVNLAIKDYGPMPNWHFGEGNDMQSSIDFVDTYMIPYLKISKNCKDNTQNECRHPIQYLNHASKEEASDKSFVFGYTRFYLADGTFVGVQLVNNTDAEGRKNIYAPIYIDINGLKKPNILGQDVFRFNYMVYGSGVFYGGKLVPTAHLRVPTVKSSVTASDVGCNLNGNGNRCSHVIMANGWKIPSKEEYVRMGGDVSLYPW